MRVRVVVFSGYCLEDVEEAVELAGFEAKLNNAAGSLVVDVVSEDEFEELRKVLGASGSVSVISNTLSY